MGEAHGGDIYRNNVDLDFSVNINPIGICEEIKNEIKINDVFNAAQLYPDSKQECLREQIAEWEGVKAEQVICGNGASELLMAVMHAIRPEYVLVLSPCFSGYERAMRAIEARPVYFDLDESQNFLLGESFLDFLKEFTVGKRRMVILTNPNNPTGCKIEKKVLKQVIEICRQNSTYVLLDECFVDFLEDADRITLVKELGTYHGLMVLKAFTKFFSIPGIRLGYLLCDSLDLLEKICIQLPEWNVSSLAQELGIKLLEHQEAYRGTPQYISRERTYLTDEIGRVFLEKGRPVRIYPSDANFILLYTDFPLYDALLERGILIRDCSNYRGLKKGYYRIAVRTLEENQTLIRMIQDI